MANYMTLLASGGPYYIVGFVITFFTLMSSRYLLGMNIYPQERIVRVMLVSAVWLPALVICTILTYVKRSDKLDQANSEAEELRRQLDEANKVIESASSFAEAVEEEQELAPQKVFNETTKAEPKAEAKPKKKGLLSW